MLDDVMTTLPIASLVSIFGVFFIYDNWRQRNKSHSLSKIAACFLFGILAFALPVSFESFVIVLCMAVVVIICSLRDVIVSQKREQAGPQHWHW